MTSFYTTTILNDPCLVSTRWLQVDVSSNGTEIVDEIKIDHFLQTIQNLARQNNVSSITVSVPIAWNTFSKGMQRENWQQSLIQLARSPQKNPHILQPTSSLHISTEVPNIESVIPLLIEQADYHSDRYPSYYRKPVDIDMSDYTQTLVSDLSDSNGLFVCAYDENNLVGYLQAARTESSIHVYELIVSKMSRGSGIGTQLLAAFLQLPEVQDHLILLETWHDQPARSLYEKFGFVPLAHEFVLDI